MGYTSRVVWADLNCAETLYRCVRRSGLSYRALAEDVERELSRIARAEHRRGRNGASVPRSCSHTLIGQLLNGQARTVHELRAVAIERALGVSDGDLFTPKTLSGIHNGGAA